MVSDRTIGVGQVALSAVAFGALGVLGHTAYKQGAQPVALLMVRFTVAAAVFAAIRAILPSARPRGRTLRGLIAMGAAYFLQSFCFFTALQYAPPGLVTLLLYTFPVIVVVLGVLVLKIVVQRSVIIACTVAVAGTALIVGPSTAGGEPLGILFGLGAALVYAVYILMGSRVLTAVDPLWASTVIMATAGAGYLLAYALSSPRPRLPASGAGWAAALAIALLCTVIASLALLAGLARVGPADASTISTVEPVVSVVLSAMVVGEAVTGWTLAGGALVLAAVIAISRTSPEVTPTAPHS